MHAVLTALAVRCSVHLVNRDGVRGTHEGQPVHEFLIRASQAEGRLGEDDSAGARGAPRESVLGLAGNDDGGTTVG